MHSGDAQPCPVQSVNLSPPPDGRQGSEAFVQPPPHVPLHAEHVPTQPHVQLPHFQPYISGYTYPYQSFQTAYQSQYQQAYYLYRPQWPYYPYVDTHSPHPYWYNGTAYHDLGGYQYPNFHQFNNANPDLSHAVPTPHQPSHLIPPPSHHIPPLVGSHKAPTANPSKHRHADSPNGSSHSSANNRS
jgi:hypothetical protein